MSEQSPLSSPIRDDDTDARSCPTDASEDEHLVIFRAPPRRTGDRCDLGQLFLAWAWFARFPGGWRQAVSAWARTLRGLEGAGLIERRTIRRPGQPTHHGFVLTDLGREAVQALSGGWIEEGTR